MNRLAAFLDRRFSVVLDHNCTGLQYFDVVQWGRRSRFSGLVVDDDVVVLDWKKLVTFRVRLSNIRGFGPCNVLRPKEGPPFARDVVTKYLSENRDNPFGLWNLLLSSRLAEKPERLTQFPPLTYSKGMQDQALDELSVKAWAGDMICTFDWNSGLSNLIRRLDWCMWSHCAIYTGQGTLVEWTTSGCVEGPFDRLRQQSLDVGLYRAGIRGKSEDERRDFGRLVVKNMRSLVGIPGYSWGTVIRTALAKNARLLRFLGPKNSISPADLMYANSHDLIAYA